MFTTKPGDSLCFAEVSLRSLSRASLPAVLQTQVPAFLEKTSFARRQLFFSLLETYTTYVKEILLSKKGGDAIFCLSSFPSYLQFPAHRRRPVCGRAERSAAWRQGQQVANSGAAAGEEDGALCKEEEEEEDRRRHEKKE